MARGTRAVTGFVVAALLLVGCGGGDDDAAPAPTAGATTSVPVATSFTGEGSARFCALARTYAERSANVNPGSTPAELRAATEEARTAIDEAAATAPAEIRPDVRVLADAFGTVFSELQRAGFDPTKVSPTAFGALQSAEFQASTVRFQAYVRQVCGISG